MSAVMVIHCLALAAIIFNGPLLPYAAQGAGMMLFGTIAICLIIGGMSSYPGMLAYPQEIPATVLGAVGTAIVAGTSGLEVEAAFHTMVVILLASGVLTGLLFLAIGHFRLANLFRFIPYPVAGGFFAGTGCVLILASLSVMTGNALDWGTLPQLLEGDLAWKWVPGAVYGLVLIVVITRQGSFIAMMGSALLVSIFFHLGLEILDISVEDAKARGLLLHGMSQGGTLWPPFSIGGLLEVDWRDILEHVPDIFTATLVTLLCLLICVNGLEVSTGVDIDLNREFRVAGMANLCAGAVGSAPGSQSFVMTLPCRRLGVDSPWIGIVVAAILGLSFFYGSGLLELIPMSVIGGILFFIGGELIYVWLVRARTWLHWSDYGIIVLICVVIALFGFIEGVGAGMLVTLAVFVFRLSRIDVVVQEFTGRERSSTRLRSIPDRAILLEHGGLLREYRLRGYIFFGSAHRLADRLKRPLHDARPPVCILLDFASVSGCDFSAIDVLRQFVRSTAATGTTVIFCAVPEQLEADFRSHLTADDNDIFRFERNPDSGLEAGEDMILAKAYEDDAEPCPIARSSLFNRVADEFILHLERMAAFEDLNERLEPWLETQTFAAGERIAESGIEQRCAHLLVAGHVSVFSAEGGRLRQCGPGDVLEPWAAFSEHPAAFTAIADDSGCTMMLTPANRERLMVGDSDLAVQLLAFLARGHSSGAMHPQQGGRSRAA